MAAYHVINDVRGLTELTDLYAALSSIFEGEPIQ